MELWRDKPDSAQCFTFWAVLMFSGAGIIHSLLQVILAIVQVAWRSRSIIEPF